VFERLHLPSLGGGAEWLNSEPLGPAELECAVLIAAGIFLDIFNVFLLLPNLFGGSE
jgi:hypothetical protein